MSSPGGPPPQPPTGGPVPALMARALALAEHGWGRVQPNPLVGAIVERDGRVVGEGWHHEFGRSHAEVEALVAAGEAARGATLHVTLEPCSHHGKTPPCTDAIAAAGVARVVYGAADPTAAGGGAERLRAAGVTVDGPVAEGAVRRQNAPFFRAAAGGPPWLALKYALSLDGRLSAEAGRPTAVTGALAGAEVHRLRAGFDAILVGSGTARADDPLLTARGEPRPRVPPIRVVADSGASLSPRSRLLATVAEAPVWVAAAEDAPPERIAALEERGARVLRLPRGGGGVAVAALLDALGERGVRSVLCEGGGLLGAGLLAADAVDRLYLLLAPVLLGDGGTPAFPAVTPQRGWRRSELRPLGEDTLLAFERVRTDG